MTLTAIANFMMLMLLREEGGCKDGCARADLYCFYQKSTSDKHSTLLLRVPANYTYPSPFKTRLNLKCSVDLVNLPALVAKCTNKNETCQLCAIRLICPVTYIRFELIHPCFS